MAEIIYIKNASVVNEGQIRPVNILIRGERIHSLLLPGSRDPEQARIIDGRGKYLIPGLIDEHVHFREPGLTHKADMATESRAALAGGITSYMEMPNTVPRTLCAGELEKKFETAALRSYANYSFYLGATNDNLQELTRINPREVCGIKVFVGSSTGSMVVDNRKTLEAIFAESPVLIATHCEDDNIIQKNLGSYKKKYGDNIPVQYHPMIRSREACLRSSSMAAELATKHGSRLHILHLSTRDELKLFSPGLPPEKKNITSEVCIHHLWFSDKDYGKLGALIKWNPAIKKDSDRSALLKGLLEDAIDTVATDHAPHARTEKSNPYTSCPSGGPMVQHGLPAMLELFHNKKIGLPRIVEKMCHAPAKIFRVRERGYIRQGYYADLVLIDPSSPWETGPHNILYKCGWSPMEKKVFRSRVTHTFLNGKLAYLHDDPEKPPEFDAQPRGMKLSFDR